ncbi:putative toxin [Microbacterium oxydans]|uniref:putative toxin n=1 Tax=Microbacterium oxydans TaxID=82380 RepID=UPI001E38E99A|nr:putative toxin [Microbacterium oxydans]
MMPKSQRRRLRFAPTRRMPFAVLSMAMTVLVAVGLFQPLEASAATAASAVRTQVAAGDGLFKPSTTAAGVVAQFTDGGPAVQAAARQALLKGGQSIDDFITSGQHEAIAQDYRLIALRLSLVGGRSVRDQADAALTSSDADALRAFVTEGWKNAWVIDDRAAAFVLADSGTPTVKREANKALDSADPNAVSQFILIGQHDAKIIDDRSAAYALASTGSPSVVAAAEAALDAMLPDGSDDTQAVADFLRYGQFVAGARDAETATIAQLTNQVIAANVVAQEERRNADNASAQAVLAARLAKEAAQRAAQQAAAAQGNAEKASAAATRAAALARQAADAADIAVQAAAAAHQAMNASMSAAGTAAAAASRANRAAASADSAAASAAGQAGNAAAARAAAEEARRVGAMADTAARAASEARTATNAANSATQAAGAAAGYSGEAAGFAMEASQASGVSSSAAAQARSAAAKANAAKDRAASATARVDRLAAETSNVAQQARDAAARASDNAKAAAIEADTAADQASVAQGAANRATASATKAAAAAKDATDAVELAKKVFALARKADTERLAAEEEFLMAQAVIAAADEAEAQKLEDDAAKEAADAVAESSAFLKKITAPNANLQELLPEARSALLSLITSGTPWIAAAAEQAVVGNNEAVVEFFKNGYAVALEQDQWDQAKALLYGDNVQLQEDAYDTLENGEEYVAEFLTVRVPEVRDLENRQAAFVLATDGGPTVKREANRALDADDPAVLAKFMAEGQYDALEIDQRAAAFALSSSGGPEVQAAANAALEGSKVDLKRFLEQGQFDAAKRDNDTAAHVAQMQSMLQLADAQAASAREASALADQAAAIARNAAAEAQASANRARQSAQEAQNWAAQAAASANQATDSENQARQSSQRAHQALTAATADAKKANGFAAQATSSAQSASASAARANDAASRAATSATNAGLDAQAAVKAATEAREIAASKQRAEDGAEGFPPPAGKEGELTQAQIDAAYALGGDAEVQRLKDAHALTQPDALLNFIIQEGGKVLLDLIGVTDIMDCVTKGDIGACVMALVGFVPWGKLAKLVEAIPMFVKLADKIMGFTNKVTDAFTALKRNKDKVTDLAGQSCNVGGNFASSNSTAPTGIWRLAVGPCGWFGPDTPVHQPNAPAHIKGQAGEQAAGIRPGEVKNTFTKDQFTGYTLTGNRIPDMVGGTFIMEVKNVNKLYYTNQIKDDLKIAQATGKPQVVLVVRPDTTLSPPLKDAICDSIDQGVKIIVKHFAPTVSGELTQIDSSSFCK